MSAPPSKGYLRAYTFARYWVAAFLCMYGFAKLFHAQFTPLLSDFDTPMGEARGIRLVWFFFGYSPVYGTLIALAQIGGAILLLFRRTTLLGALLLLPVMANIALVDVFYQIDLGATVNAFILLALLLFLIDAHKAELKAAVWAIQDTMYGGPEPSTTYASLRKNALRAAIVLVPAIFAWWVRNYNNISPTPIDGKWTIESVSPGGLRTLSLLDSARTIYFEPDFAHLGMLRTNEGFRETRFEVDAQNGTIRIREPYWEPKRDLLNGRYTLAGDTLTLTGRMGEDSVTILLRRS